jgi:hypothetical protein
MTTRIENRNVRLSLFATVASLLLGMGAMTPTIAAAQPIPPPTVGEIVVESYNCETGQLVYRVDVANLVHVAGASDQSDYPMRLSEVSQYEGGASFTPEFYGVFQTSAASSPYTGAVTTTTFVPTTAPDGVGTAGAPLIAIVITVSVGHASSGPIDATSTTYTVDCDGGSLVDSLVAALKRILRDILGR